MKILCKIFAATLMILAFNQLQSRNEFNKSYFEFQSERQRLLAKDKEASKKNLPLKPPKGKNRFVHQDQQPVFTRMRKVTNKPDRLPSVPKKVVGESATSEKTALDRQYEVYQKLSEDLKAWNSAEASRLATKQMRDQEKVALISEGDQLTRSAVQAAPVISVPSSAKKVTRKAKKSDSMVQTAAVVVPTMPSTKKIELNPKSKKIMGQVAQLTRSFIENGVKYPENSDEYNKAVEAIFADNP